MPVAARVGVSRSQAGDAAALGALGALTAWQLWPSAGPARLPQNLDLMLQYLPNGAYLSRSLAGGRLPLWNPYLGAGAPFAADPGTGTWYLPNWPLWLGLSLEAAVRAVLWVHLVWAVLGSYVYLRAVLRVAPVPAWIGAAAFALSTWLPGLAGMPVVLISVSWLPWLLLCGARAAARGGRWTAALAGAGALQVVAGWPAGAYLTWLALAWLVVTRSPALALGRLSGRVALVRAGFIQVVLGAALAAMLAGVLLVPAAEFVAETSYAQTRPLDRVAHEGYLTLLSWLRPAGGSGSLESSQLYLGMAPLLLVIAGMAFGPRREAIAFGGLALCSLLVAAGTHGPLFSLLYRWLPGFRIVYLPARLGVLAAFALACLAALGAQRLLAGEHAWSRSHVGAVAGMAVATGMLGLGQFWLSEGYDHFRRLLTNVGRFSGGPFLTHEQEVHYAVFGLLALGGMALATQLPGRWAAMALVALTAADLGLAQSRTPPPAFEPRAWYRPALESAGRLAGELGHSRFAGLQWHDSQHFLNDFPASALPELLPPNLGLLVGLRDAQAYNPLLLRRAVSYFGEINGGELDDHWLWIKDFQSPQVDRLAVRRVLAAGAEWRVQDRLLASASRLPPDGTDVIVWRAAVGAPLPVTGRLRLVSYLGESTAMTDGSEAVEVRVLAASGVEQRLSLRAGRETAEWAYGRSDVQAAVKHARAAVALETRLVDAVSSTFSVYEYLATLELGELLEIREVRARSIVPGVAGYIQGLWIDPVATPSAASAAVGVLPPPGSAGTGIEQLGAQARISIAAGSAVLLVDEPERITARVNAPLAGELVLADAYYPGWTATVNGTAVTITPATRLFRALGVEPGEYDVTYVYRPLSLRIGFALSAFGLLMTIGVLLADSRANAPALPLRPTRRQPRSRR